ncbi:MAG TPA: hypothetical protein VK658_06225, partial [Chryseolinea sp.]|nr:hypothetical protein [Chryseolinea sp.]
FGKSVIAVFQRETDESKKGLKRQHANQGFGMPICQSYATNQNNSSLLRALNSGPGGIPALFSQ